MTLSRSILVILQTLGIGKCNFIPFYIILIFLSSHLKYVIITRNQFEKKDSIMNSFEADSTIKNKKWKKVLLIIILFFVAIAFLAIGYVAYVVKNAEDIDADNIYNILSESSVIYDDQGKKIDTVYATENRTNVSYKDLPDNLKNAFIAIEDKTFWKHSGFNFVRIVGALKDSITTGRVSGTSTISQQLARNIFLKESKSERSIKRKIIEAYYTVKIEKTLSKQQILEAYLNTIALGNNSNGVQTASQAYFSKDVGDLSILESALLAALPKAPTDLAYIKFVNLSDINNYKQDQVLNKTDSGAYVLNDIGLERAHLCLKLMKEQNMITEKQYKKAVSTPLKDVINPNYTITSQKAAYFNDFLINQVVDDIAAKFKLSKEQAREKVYDGGLRIYSTLDSQAQDIVETEFENDANFPDPINMNQNQDGNFVDDSGNVVLYNYSNYFAEDGSYTFPLDEAYKNKNGSITLTAGKKLNFYNTQVAGKADISIEFKSLFRMQDNHLYVISGGFINVTQGDKKKDDNGNTIISAKFVKEHPDWFIIGDDGRVTITANSYKLKQQVVQPQAAMTIVDVHTGQIKAMIGGRETEGRSLFNRADSPRQPGSAIKPIGVYAPAIQQSADEASSGVKHTFQNFNIDKQGTKYWGDYITSASVILDEQTRINGKIWPSNADSNFMGPLDLKSAIAYSRNPTAVKTLLQVGASYCLSMLEKFGITTVQKDGNINDLNSSALALGGMVNGISPLELSNAYTAFANGGTVYKPLSYTKVEDRKGKVILDAKENKGTKVLSDGVSFVMNQILQYSAATGYAKDASIAGIRVGAKTGTTSDDLDVWCAGYTPSYAAALWIGNDVSISLSNNSTAASLLWGRIMRQINRNYQGSYPQQPSNVINIGSDYFVKGTETGIVSVDKVKQGLEEQKPKKVMICKDSGMLATPWCTNLVETEFENGKDERIPKYHCPLHNKDVKKYPIAPDAKLPESDENDPDNPQTPPENEEPNQ